MTPGQLFELLKHWRRRCLYGAALIVVLLLGFPVIEHFRGKARLTLYKGKLAAAGERLLGKQVVIPVPREENGFPALLSRLNELPSLDGETVPPIVRRLQHGKAMVIHKAPTWRDSSRKP